MEIFIKAEFDLFDDIILYKTYEDEEYDCELDDLEQDRTGASDDKTILD